MNRKRKKDNPWLHEGPVFREKEIKHTLFLFETLPWNFVKLMSLSSLAHMDRLVGCNYVFTPL